MTPQPVDAHIKHAERLCRCSWRVRALAINKVPKIQGAKISPDLDSEKAEYLA